VHDVLDELERVLSVLAKADEGDVRTFPRRRRSHVLNGDLSRYYLVAQGGDNPRDEWQPIRALVRDQHA
jgi:hypothetical protein